MLLREQMINKKILSIEAKISNLDKVTDFVRAKLEEKGCTSGQIMQCCLAAEEIFVNIAKHWKTWKCTSAGK